MSHNEFEPQTSPFGVVEQPEDINGYVYIRKNIAVDPSKISGFETSQVPDEVVASILGHTINGMVSHGASALGLDLDSMMGRIHASGHIAAALGVGTEILDDIAPRTDETTWKEWVKSEFPNAVASIYGANSDPAKLAIVEMSRHLLS